MSGSALAVLVAISVVLAILAHRFEPYIRARIVEDLQQRFHTHVELGEFHVSVHHGKQAMWGLWATGRGLRIWPPHRTGGDQKLNQQVESLPLISLDQFSFHVPLRLEVAQRLRIAEVKLMGLNIHVPPKSERDKRSGLNSSMTPPPPNGNGGGGQGALSQVVVERVMCENAELTMETDKPDKLPMVFAFAKLVLSHVTAGEPVAFTAEMVNPKPRGAITTSGKFGPWNVYDPGESPLSGTYHFAQADLGTFKGIAGMLHSDGAYVGTLSNITVDGRADVPDFRLTEFNEPMPLHTKFHARVDGTDGDTWLKPVEAMLGKSQFTTEGKIVRVKPSGSTPEDETTKEREAATPGGHLIDLKIDIPNGNLDDFMRLVSHTPTPMLTGDVAVQARLKIPPGTDPVSRRMQLDGYFTLNNAQFTSDKIQEKVEELSLRGQGKPGDRDKGDHDAVHSHMQGGFHMAKGTIQLPDLQYAVPGADIRLRGTYALNGDLNFLGTARMQATISAMVGGWKGFLLKPVDPFFKKDGAGALIPIRISGTRQSPDFGVDWGHFRSTRPERPGAKP